MTKLNKTLNST